MKAYITFFLLIWFYTLSSICTAQENDLPGSVKAYPFINYKENKLAIHNTAAYDSLFKKLTLFGLTGSGKTNIVHIGDSHLQADFFSGKFRRKIQTFFLGGATGRGFVFPYTLAQTNNPLSYKVDYTGKWENCRNVDKPIHCNLGLSGIAVSSSDSSAKVQIVLKDKEIAHYDFDRVMIFHDMNDTSYIPVLKISDQEIQAIPNKEEGYSLFMLPDNFKKMELAFKKGSPHQNYFRLHGINFDSSDAGIVYHTVGVNGAEVESYLNCNLFNQHLAALNPDWVIVSLGTNDVYTNAFSGPDFKNNLDLMIDNIQTAAPNAAVLFTTPGDHRIKKTEHNPKTVVASKLIAEVSENKSISYWDFYKVMGGFGSIDYWYAEKMAHTDYLHYTQKGYAYQADLLFKAFLNAYSNYLNQLSKKQSAAQ